MGVVVATIGTRGDVQPCALLGAGLARAGHAVRLVTHERFRPLADAHGLGFASLPGDPERIFDGWRPEGISPWRPAAHLGLIHERLGRLVAGLDPAALAVSWRDAELVVFTPTTAVAGHLAAELGVPGVMAALTPAVTTRAFPHPVAAPFLALGPRANEASWLAGERLQRQTFCEPLRPARRRVVGLSTLPLAGGRERARWPPFPVLHGFSPELVARPPDWPPHVSVTGWWLAPPPRGPLPGDVEEFLHAGPPPLYVGFGSMVATRREAVAAALADALERSGERAVVSGLDTAALRARPGRVLARDGLDHDALFPRVKAVVHHGGSGTTGTGLRAGRPTLVIPFVFDQFFWGRRVARAGAGPPPLPYAKLTAERLAGRLAALSSPRIGAAAAALGRRIAAEDGVAAAVGAVERARR